MLPFDLHVLGLPPAFTLSQDQTLHLKFVLTEVNDLFLVKEFVKATDYSLAYCLLELIGSC